MGDFAGFMVTTWDPQEKTYKEYFFGDQFPGAVAQIRSL
jgi:hypothetical protein